MHTLNYILEKFHLDIEHRKSPIEIPNFGRDNLAELFNELGFRIGVELGVEQGLYSEVLCKANPNMQLYSVDAWASYQGYRDHKSQEKLDGFYEDAKDRLAPYSNCHIMRRFSAEAVSYFENKSLDFVYIDANHEFYWFLQDLRDWLPKVRKGGIICGHDYIESTRNDSRNHVIPALHGFTHAYRIHPWFVLGRKRCPDTEIRDKTRSWMWVRLR